jgi:hypothetical protein
MAWIVELLDVRVRDELGDLPADIKARFRRIVELIQGFGLERMREPYVKHLDRERPARGRRPFVCEEGPENGSARA